MEFTFSKKAKTLSLILIVIGVLSLGFNFFTDHSHHHGLFWSNVLFNGFFFFSIALGALFFMALQYATETAWSVLVKRVFEAIISYLPFGAIVLVIVFLAGTFHWHHIYPWMNPDVFDVNHADYDEIIANKESYLNLPFFWVRTAVYLAVFILFARMYRKRSLAEDKQEKLSIHYKNYKQAGLFLVLFAVFSSTLSWDWIMSIDTHWFSTLFGWYVLSGMWLMAVTVTILITLYLKSKGHLPLINKNHLHDLGKWMFALSFLWTYLWFSQFMLIWYADMAEEVVYFKTRIDHYQFLFFFTMFVNFAAPMLILMSRDAKRNKKFLMVMGIVIFLGHWLDAYLLFVPGVLFEHGHLSWVHFGTMLGFLGFFIYVVFTTLTKAPLVPVNHPYKDESVHHEI